MNVRSLLAVPALLTGLLVGAQNQSWTATDIDGNSIHLQDYLDQGKTVLVDISAYWCGPCWAWHTSGIMEKLYHEFGPEGTNDLVIIWVDGDAATTSALLHGATGSQGDWVTGTPYPIIGPNGQGNTLANLYGITAYPTLFMHCPGANAGVEIQRQSTWQAFFNSWRTACPAPFNNGANDATLMRTESGVLCPGEHPKVELYNQGTSTLTSATVKLMQGTTVLQTVNWTGSLARWASTNVSFDNVNVVGTQTYTGVVSMPNGTADEHPEGDEEDYEYSPAPQALLATVQLELKTDNYCEETSWKLYNAANQVIQQAGPYTANTQDNTVFNYWWNLNPNECYRLEILDAYGDGFCCSYGNGYYKVRSGGVIIAQGGQFGAVAKAPFAAGAVVGIEENSLEEGLSMFPNPTNGTLNVRFNMTSAATVRIKVLDLMGAEVMTMTKGFGTGDQQTTLDLSALANGSYIVNILADGLTATRKVTVNQ
ncbi:MAG: T9SS type A sorting domain-containing protein [Flavobacteriales bacterium]|nr:T9SS type A sorting domain-containing protein [Flavobacteriales bacterium]MCC6937291.1 T9SS type A sorting domain-containing protein [Flavobacteriales bacterium]